MINSKNVKLKLLSLAFVIFFLGGISGAAVHALYQVKFGTQTNPRQGGLTEMMKKDLNLTDEQTVQVKSILDDSRKEFRRVMKEECPGVENVRTKTNERIKAILTPEQQQKFEEIRAKREAMFKEKEKEKEGK